MNTVIRVVTDYLTIAGVASLLVAVWMATTCLLDRLEAKRRIAVFHPPAKVVPFEPRRASLQAATGRRNAVIR